MNLSNQEILDYHLGGKVGLRLTKPLNSPRDLSIAYTPGVAVPVKEIHRERSAIFSYTAKSNLVAVVSDGTAILGLGDLGAEASLPVMEGKAVLFKAFGDVDAWPIPLNRCRKNGQDIGPTDPDRVVEITAALAPAYGGINLEDISAPACFEIEERLDAQLDIPVFHDDQWGTAVITLAAVKNYCIISGRDLSELRVVINGAGAAGIRIAEILKTSGARSLLLCDSKGVVRSNRTDLNPRKRQFAVDSSATTIGEAMRGAHVFIGVSVANCINPADVLSMAPFPAIFAMANPDPEIRPEAVSAAFGKQPYVMATGRSDYPNQINNVLGFPFLFRGALDSRAKSINIEMKLAAAEALARVAREPVPVSVQKLYPDTQLELGPSYLIPKPFDPRLFVEVSWAVANAALKSNAAEAMDMALYRRLLEMRNEERLRGTIFERA